MYFIVIREERSSFSLCRGVYGLCSPLNDLLEKDSFTLEEVLQEDELIQEVKSRNQKLIDLYVRPMSHLFYFTLKLLMLLLVCVRMNVS